MIYHCIRFTLKPGVSAEDKAAGLENLQAYEEYMNHPAHLEMDRIGLPLVDKFVSFDITDDPDPAVGEKIAEIHRRRFDGTPDIAELVSGLAEYTGSAVPGKHGRPAGPGVVEK